MAATVHTVNVLLGVLGQAGLVGHALFLLREAVLAGYELGLAAYSTVLHMLAVVGDWQSALGVRRAMALLGVQCDSTAAGLLVSAAQRGGNPELATQLAGELAGATQAQGVLPQPPSPTPLQQQQQYQYQQQYQPAEQQRWEHVEHAGQHSLLPDYNHQYQHHYRPLQQ